MNLVKMSFRGIELQVPEASVGLVVRQLLNIESASSTFERPSVQAAQGSLQLATVTPSTAQSMDVDITATVSSGMTFDAKLTLSFLEAILEGENWAVPPDAEKIGQVLGVKHAKGIGSKTAMINRTLHLAGFDPESVYDNPRDSAGARHWLPGPALLNAITAFRKEADNS